MNTRKLERIVKGFANHRRIQMMELLEQQPDLSLADVCARLRVGIKGGSEHLRKLAIAGLITKQHRGRIVQHRLSSSGKHILSFCRTLE